MFDNTCFIFKCTASQTYVSNPDSSHEPLNHISNFRSWTAFQFFHSHLKPNTVHSWMYHLLGQLYSASVFPILVHSFSLLLNPKAVTMELSLVVRSPSVLLSNSFILLISIVTAFILGSFLIISCLDLQRFFTLLSWLQPCLHTDWVS